MEWSFRSDQPIYSQLTEQIKLGIVSGEFSPGQRLLSVRDMAEEAGVNPNTMQRALQELERDGIVYTQRTAGRFVTEDRAVIDKLKKDLAGQQAESFLGAMARLGYGREDIIALLKEKEEENNANT